MAMPAGRMPVVALKAGQEANEFQKPTAVPQVQPPQPINLSSQTMAETAVTVFRVYDTECRNQLSREPMMAALSELGVLNGLTGKKLNEILSMGSDPNNKNRTYSLQEFIAFYERLVRFQGKMERDNRIKNGNGHAGIPAGAEDNELLKRVFRNYCKYTVGQGRMTYSESDPQMSSTQFVKLCQDLGLVQPNGSLNVVTIDLTFHKCKPVGGRRLTYPQFLRAMACAAEESQVNVFELMGLLAQQIQPKQVAFIAPQPVVFRQEAREWRMPVAGESSEGGEGPEGASRLPPLSKADAGDESLASRQLKNMRSMSYNTNSQNGRSRRATESSIGSLVAERSAPISQWALPQQQQQQQQQQPPPMQVVPDAAVTERLLQPLQPRSALLGSPAASDPSTLSVLNIAELGKGAAAPPWAQALLLRMAALEANQPGPTADNGSMAREQALLDRIAGLEAQINKAAAEGGSHNSTDATGVEAALAAVMGKALRSQVEDLQSAVTDHEQVTVASRVASHQSVQPCLLMLLGQLREQQQELADAQAAVQRTQTQAAGTGAILPKPTAAAGNNRHDNSNAPTVSSQSLETRVKELQAAVAAGITEVQGMQREEQELTAQLARLGAGRLVAGSNGPSTDLQAAAAAAAALSTRVSTVQGAARGREPHIAALRAGATRDLAQRRPAAERLRALEGHHVEQRARLAQARQALRNLKLQQEELSDIGQQGLAGAGDSAAAGRPAMAAAEKERMALEEAVAALLRDVDEVNAQLSILKPLVLASAADINNLSNGSTVAVKADQQAAAKLLGSLQALEGATATLDPGIATVRATSLAALSQQECCMAAGDAGAPPPDASKLGQALASVQTMRTLEAAAATAAGTESIQLLLAGRTSLLERQVRAAQGDAMCQLRDQVAQLQGQHSAMASELAALRTLGGGSGGAGSNGASGGGRLPVAAGALEQSMRALEEAVQAHAAASTAVSLHHNLQLADQAIPTTTELDARLRGQHERLGAVQGLLIAAREMENATASQAGQLVAVQVASCLQELEGQVQDLQAGVPADHQQLSLLHGKLGSLAAQLMVSQKAAAEGRPAPGGEPRAAGNALSGMLAQLAVLQASADERDVRIARLRAAAQRTLGADGAGGARLATLQSALKERAGDCEVLAAAAAALREQEDAAAVAIAAAAADNVSARPSRAPPHAQQAKALAALAAQLKEDNTKDIQEAATLQQQLHNTSDSASRTAIAAQVAALEADMAARDERFVAAHAVIRQSSSVALAAASSVQQEALEATLGSTHDHVSRALAAAGALQTLESATSAGAGPDFYERLHAVSVLVAADGLQGVLLEVAALKQRVAQLEAWQYTERSQTLQSTIQALRGGVQERKAGGSHSELSSSSLAAAASISELQARVQKLEGQEAHLVMLVNNAVALAEKLCASAADQATDALKASQATTQHVRDRSQLMVAAAVGNPSASDGDGALLARLRVVEERMNLTSEDITKAEGRRAELQTLHQELLANHEQLAVVVAKLQAVSGGGGSGDGTLQRLDVLEEKLAKHIAAAEKKLGQVQDEVGIERERLDGNLHLIEANMQMLQQRQDQASGGRVAALGGSAATIAQLADIENTVLDKLGVYHVELQGLQQAVNQVAGAVSEANKDISALGVAVAQAHGAEGGSVPRASQGSFVTWAALQELQAVVTKEDERVMAHARHEDQKLAARLDMKDQALLKIARQLDYLQNTLRKEHADAAAEAAKSGSPPITRVFTLRNKAATVQNQAPQVGQGSSSLLPLDSTSSTNYGDGGGQPAVAAALAAGMTRTEMLFGPPSKPEQHNIAGCSMFFGRNSYPAGYAVGNGFSNVPQTGVMAHQLGTPQQQGGSAPNSPARNSSPIHKRPPPPPQGMHNDLAPLVEDEESLERLVERLGLPSDRTNSQLQQQLQLQQQQQEGLGLPSMSSDGRLSGGLLMPAPPASRLVGQSRPQPEGFVPPRR